MTTSKAKIIISIITGAICLGAVIISIYTSYIMQIKNQPGKPETKQTSVNTKNSRPQVMPITIQKISKDAAITEPDFSKHMESSRKAINKTSKKTLPKAIKKILSLKTKGYQDYTLKEFADYISRCYEKDHSLWKTRQNLHIDKETEENLTTEDYNFITTTIYCTESESGYSHDRAGNIPADFSRTYEFPYPKYATTLLFEWCVQYKIQKPVITVGQRDKLVLNVKNGMDEFMENVPNANNRASRKFLKKMRRHLKKLVKENNGQGLDMDIFFCR